MLTPLHVAAGFGHSSVVEVLIRSHADVNAVEHEVSECIHTTIQLTEKLLWVIYICDWI